MKIKDQYSGLTESELWKSWKKHQRVHFFQDHKESLDMHKPMDLLAYAQQDDFEKLPHDIQEAVSQHMINGQYKNGGGIPNNYEGKTAEQIWNEWTSSQRLHFLEDHTGREHTPTSMMEYSHKNWRFLLPSIKKKIEEHVSSGQYGLGGTLGRIYGKARNKTKEAISEAKRVGKKVRTEGFKGAKEVGKEYGSKAVKGTKNALKESYEGYKSEIKKLTNTDKKIHDKNKKTALIVIDSTKDKVSNETYKNILRGAENIIEDKYGKGGGIGKGFNVFNYTDNIYATDEVFKTKKEANDFIKQFRKRYEKQGYYRDNRGNKLKLNEIDLLAIPENFSPYTGETIGEEKMAGGGIIKTIGDFLMQKVTLKDFFK